jgi:hypothetical protein
MPTLEEVHPQFVESARLASKSMVKDIVEDLRKTKRFTNPEKAIEDARQACIKKAHQSMSEYKGTQMKYYYEALAAAMRGFDEGLDEIRAEWLKTHKRPVNW